jgi:DNA-binding NarL/FixJ family response regulator
MTIRVLVADDQPLMRTAYEMTLRTEDDLELVGQAGDGTEAIELARRLHPDVILMDIRMPALDGVEATRVLCAEDHAIKVLILTTFDIDEYVVEALRAGASGFLLKDVRPDELVEAIRIVARGDALLAPSVTRRLLEAVASSLEAARPRRDAALDALTDSELRVLALVGRGLSNEEIARDLFVADTTVRTHLRHILDKLGLRNRVQAVVLAYDTGLVEPQART